MTARRRIKKYIGALLVLIVLAVVYRYNPYQLEFLGHYDKIWAHRVNSLDKLSLSKPFFNGVELDLVYNPGRLEVRHPPKPFTGLTFKEYAKQIDSSDSLQLWLDIKNLEPVHMAGILALLQEALAETGMDPSQVYIESRDPMALPIFNENGFKTLFYLPSDLRLKSEEVQRRNLKAIYGFLDLQPWMGISTHYKDYELLKTHFAGRDKFLWITPHDRFKDYGLIRDILKDPTVKVALIRYKALKGN